MSSTLTTSHSQTLKINCHDPRGHQAFLQFSNDMHHWQTYANNSGWWLEREKQCLGLFQQYGYDLQSGVWYCLIACQRNGWKGIANASLLLANGFAKQQPPCWPPIAAMDLRRQILEGYCIHLQPLIFALPMPVDNTLILQQLFNAMTLLQGHAAALQSTKLAAFQQMSAWLSTHIKAIEQQALSPAHTSRPSTDASALLFSLPLPPARTRWRVKGLWGMAGALMALSIVGIIQGIHDPVALNFSNRIWPGNPLFAHWKQNLLEESNMFPANKTYERLNQQLNTLEQRLLDAEQKRKPYLTISELKTNVYQMQQTLDGQKKIFEFQLNDVQTLRDRHQPLPSEVLMSLSLKREALNSRFLYLTNDEMFDDKNLLRN